MQRHMPSKGKQTKFDLTRGVWGSKFQFFLSSLGYAIGFGNVWRFPYLAYENGGGTFLIPYVIMIFFVGLPLFFLEVAVGQYSRVGPSSAYARMTPIMSGLGICMLAASFLLCIYYNVLVSWVIYYIFAGFAEELPWAKCAKNHGSHCIDAKMLKFGEPMCVKNGGPCISAAENFFQHDVMGGNCSDCTDWEHYGSLQWKLVLCLLLAWFVTGASLIKGIQSSGKVMYFTATCPFFVLFVLFCFSLRLDGSTNGINYYVTPDPKTLGTAEPWVNAASQIFFSLGIGFGGLITLGSFNEFDNSCHLDAIAVALLNCATSFFAGLVIFSFLGYMAKSIGQPIEEVVHQGVLLTFVTVPDAVTHMPLPPIWSFMFFVMLFTLGLDSLFLFMETLIYSLIEHFPVLQQKKPYVITLSCLLGFVLGLSMCTPRGVLVLNMLDTRGAQWTVLLLGLFELCTVSYLYKVNRFWSNVEQMGLKMSKYLKFYWIICLSVIAPVMLSGLLLWQFVTYSETFKGKPDIIIALGMLTSLFTLVWIPIFSIKGLWSQMQNKSWKFAALVRPTSDWPFENENMKGEVPKERRERATDTKNRQVKKFLRRGKSPHVPVKRNSPDDVDTDSATEDYDMLEYYTYANTEMH